MSAITLAGRCWERRGPERAGISHRDGIRPRYPQSSSGKKNGRGGVAMTKRGYCNARAARQLVQKRDNWADQGQMAETERAAAADLTLGSPDQI